MTSKFVSAGSTDDLVQTSDEWEKAKKDIEETRRRKEQEGRQEGGKSLYEVLQQNKVAKQEAFEESIRLKNQFRSLDEDEVEFLDSVLESTRAKEEAVKKETTEQLDIFRRQQEQVDKALLLQDTEDGVRDEGSLGVEDQGWKTGGKKRRKTGEKETLKGVKIRKISISEKPPSASAQSLVSGPKAGESVSQAKSSPQLATPRVMAARQTSVSDEHKSAAAGSVRKKDSGGGLLGLDYSSDEGND